MTVRISQKESCFQNFAYSHVEPLLYKLLSVISLHANGNFWRLIMNFDWTKHGASSEIHIVRHSGYAMSNWLWVLIQTKRGATSEIQIVRQSDYAMFIRRIVDGNNDFLQILKEKKNVANAKDWKHLPTVL